MKPTTVALDFVTAINSGDPDAIASLMADEHVFIDSLGARIEDHETMHAGWHQYFAIFPDYHLHIDGVYSAGNEVMLHGRASGTLHRDGTATNDGSWIVPAAWRAVVAGGKVTLWQVYADNKPVYELLARG